jgi:hypothetical protein
MQPSALLLLPNELLLRILAYAGPVEQLFLALACKQLLKVSAMMKISIPSASKHHAYALDCPALLGILRCLPSRGLSKRSWALCCDCYRYRPKRSSYWLRIVGKRCIMKPYCELLKDFELLVQRWSKAGSSSHQCPECWCEANIRKYGYLCHR